MRPGEPNKKTGPRKKRSLAPFAGSEAVLEIDSITSIA